jgi:hypothetical protein
MATCRKCGEREAPAYHDWCGPCHAARRRERERTLQAADPGRKGWVRDWNRLKMRAYRGHEMQEEPCRVCGIVKGRLMLLGQNPLRWTVVCRKCRTARYPGRDVTGWSRKKLRRPPGSKQEVRVFRRTVARETAGLGL